MPDSESALPFDRRRFLQVTAAAAASMLTASVASAQTASPAPKPTPAPAAPPATPTPPSDEARALTAILQKRFPDRLSAEQWDAVARDFEADLGAGRRLAAMKFSNADEPDASFRA